MNNTISVILLIISVLIFSGCSMLAPFKSINSCSDTKNNGAACASVESNLEYSINKDNPTEVPPAVPQSSNNKQKKSKKETVEITAPALPSHDEIDVMKDEIVRLMAEMSIDTNITKKPTLIPSVTYRLLIFPYSVNERFYSARYVYITAGKPRWVTGNYILSEGQPIQINTPAAKASFKRPEDVVSGININVDEGSLVQQGGSDTEMPESSVISKQISPKNLSEETKTKHRVSAYLLNCRDMPGMEGNAIAVFEQDRIVDVVDKSLPWWEVSFYDMTCYVNPIYLYKEPIE